MIKFLKNVFCLLPELANASLNSSITTQFLFPTRSTNLPLPSLTLSFYLIQQHPCFPTLAHFWAKDLHDHFENLPISFLFTPKSPHFFPLHWFSLLLSLNFSLKIFVGFEVCTKVKRDSLTTLLWTQKLLLHLLPQNSRAMSSIL